MYDYLSDLLNDLDGVMQAPKYHPEGDALFHSLQVFQLAYQNSHNPKLWAAALFHDVGKAIAGPDHDVIGAEMLESVLHTDIVWLVRHHLDLLKAPRSTRHKYASSPRFADLQRLRRFDLSGRDPAATVISPAWAIELLVPHTQLIAA